MELKTCSNCLVEVIPTTDGDCPSCRKPLVPLLESSDCPPSSKPPVVMGVSRHAGDDTSLDSANPYQASTAWRHADDPDDEQAVPQERGLLWMLFSCHGRIGRRELWGYSLLVLVFYYASVVALGVIHRISLPYMVHAIADFGLYNTLVFLMYLPVFALVVWMNVALHVKRWHDHNLSGWWWLVVWIPFVGPFVVFVQLGLMRGTAGPNRYGPDPT